MTELLLALALAATALPSFPRPAGGRIAAPAIGAVVAGAPTVVVAAGDRLTGFRPDGSAAPGLPLVFGDGDEAVGAPATADVDGDGRAELAVATRSGRVFLWSGGVVPGFPVKLGARAKAGVSFGDVDGDGRPELLVGDEQGRVHALKRNGREAGGWPATVGCAVTSSVSSSVFAGGRSFAVGCEDGKVHVLDAAGRPRAGFPLVTKFAVTGAPVFADLDDDGEMDLLAGSQDFGLHAVSARGAPLPGFPARAAYRLYEGPAVADLDGDRRLDVVFASADGMVHAVDAGGERLPGFPARVGQRVFGGVAVGDVDRDGGLDVVVATADGTVAALDRKGKPVPGFPALLEAADASASPLLLDLAGDGTLSAFVGLPTGELHALRAPRGVAVAVPAPWPAPARDGARTGRRGPNPPAYKELVLVPPEPRAPDVLAASWRAVHLDAAPGEPAPAPRISWLRNGKPVPGLEGKRQLPPGTVRRGERWRFALASPAGDASAESPEVVVLDTAPGAPEVALAPAVPTRAGDVRLEIVKPAADPDGDPLRLEVAWLLDGVETGVKGEVFPASGLRRGAALAVRVVASDGELRGPPARAEVRVGDTAPGPLRIALAPERPAATDPVRASIAQRAVDLDGDPLVHHYAWKVGGAVRNLPAESETLPPGLFRKHEKVEVEVRAFDGERYGPPARAEVTARNTPPTAPRVEIRPARPRRGEPLRAAVVAPAEDADRDPLAYTFAWRKNGAPVEIGGEGREVPGALVARGDAFELTVTASDGEASGPAGTASVRIANTPPAPPRIALEPRQPRGGEPLRLVVKEPARDADGDEVALSIAWTRDGKATGDGAETLPPSAFAKRERVRVVVTPRDGTDAGPPAVEEVRVEDAAPGAAVVAFASDRPTVGAPLQAVVATPSKDPDGDEVDYRYRWLRDGIPFPVPDETPESKEAPFWTWSSAVPAWSLTRGQRWTVELRPHDGEKYGPISRAEVVVVNAPPPAPRIVVSPARPRRVDPLSVQIEQPPDPDGDAVTWRYAWTRNGERVDAPPDRAQVPRGVARKGERWAVEVVASDGAAESPAARHEVVIADSAPGPAAVALCDGPVPAGTVPQARIVAPAVDADGDTVAYRHEWILNDAPVRAASGQTRLAAPALRKHDRVRLVVTPFDGELAGPASAAECEVRNTPPGAPAAALEPAEPTAGSGVAVALRKPSADHDGDPVEYRYAWWRDGVPVALERAKVAPATLRHGERWRVEVIPFDGEEEGERLVLETRVRNTPPPAPAVALAPASAAAGEPVACDVQVAERDDDGEPVLVRRRWLRGARAEPFADASEALPQGVVRRDERWRCEAWTSDGTVESARAGAELVVRNTPPAAPRVAIEPARPRRGDALSCRLAVASADADADPVSYAYAWTEDDRTIAAGADPSRVDGARVSKGKRWRCTVTPRDGTAAGTAASAEVVVGNSPPGPAVARLAPGAPREGEPIRCDVATPSADPDGEPVRYRYAWQRNGVAQPFAETSVEVPPRLVKAGDRWRCTLTPTDGAEDGPPAPTEEATVLPPGAGAPLARTVDGLPGERSPR
jgi:hypothetical protein